MTHSGENLGPGGGVYEDPDNCKLANVGQESYELMQCPAFESTSY